MSKWRIFIVSLALLTLLVILMTGCNNEEKYSVTVDVDPVGAGHVTLSEKGPFNENTQGTHTAKSANGYVYDHWTGVAIGNINPTINSPVVGTYDYDDGAVVDATATAAEYREFGEAGGGALLRAGVIPEGGIAGARVVVVGLSLVG